MHQGPIAMGNFSNLGDGLEGSRFVIGSHDTDQCRLLINGGLNVRWPYPPVRINWKLGHAKAMQASKLTTGGEHSGMFSDLCDEMLPALLPGKCDPTNGKSIALRPSSGKDNFSRCTGK